MIDELGVTHVRLPIYWSEVEVQEGTYRWETVDRLVMMAEEAQVALIPVVGAKVPRWPECFIPDWAELLSEPAQYQQTQAFIETVVNRYKDSPAVIRWQVENEPFFPFGECELIDEAEFASRVALVERLDDRPIQSTVSGEIGPWEAVASRVDILGISLYRQTWNPIVGYFIYPLTPDFYTFRAAIMRDRVSSVIVSELQAEPWFAEPIESRPITQWYDAFTVEMLEDNVEFARKAGLSEAYLWGVEWWYALNQAGDPRLWDAAAMILN